MNQRIATLVFALLMGLGCGNPFAQFYNGSTLVQANTPVVHLAERKGPVVVESVGNIDQSCIEKYEDGWMPLGFASWTGPDPGSNQDAVSQAQKIGASLVLHTWELLGERTTMMPLTMPTTTTTYSSGIYGSSAWSGSSTSYGSSTTYYPMTIRRYSASAAFLAKRLGSPIFGVSCRRLTAAEQSQSGSVEGLFVVCVVRDSPAANCGVLPGDILKTIDGDRMSTPDGLLDILASKRGQAVTISLRRGLEVLTIRSQFSP